MKQKKWLKVLTVVVAVILVLVLAFFGTVHYFLGKIQRETGTESVVPPKQETFETDTDAGKFDKVEESDVFWGDPVSPTDLKDDDLINILLVGQDRREGQGRQRSDTMILLSFNPKTNQMSMISFLRDMYVRIPGYSPNRLNAAYAFGGFDLLKRTLKSNFAVTVDGCFEVDFTAFKKVIDLVGGVDVHLTAAEAKIVGDGAKEGTSHLDGDHALMYARIRKLDSDFGRTARQRNVLKAVINKVKGSGPVELINLLNIVLPYLKTDMTNGQIMSMAFQYASSFSGMGLSTYSVPAGDCYRSASVRGMSVLIPNLSRIRQRLYSEYLPRS